MPGGLGWDTAATLGRSAPRVSAMSRNDVWRVCCTFPRGPAGQVHRLLEHDRQVRVVVAQLTPGLDEHSFRLSAVAQVPEDQRDVGLPGSEHPQRLGWFSLNELDG